MKEKKRKRKKRKKEEKKEKVSQEHKEKRQCFLNLYLRHPFLAPPTIFAKRMNELALHSDCLFADLVRKRRRS